MFYYDGKLFAKCNGVVLRISLPSPRFFKVYVCFVCLGVTSRCLFCVVVWEKVFQSSFLKVSSSVWCAQTITCMPLPFGMWCLSACGMMLASVVFTLCGWVGIFAFFSFFCGFYTDCFLVVIVWVFLLLCLK